MDELDKLLSHSFEEIKQNRDLIIKLLQLSQNFLNLSITDCEKQHRSYYEKLKTIKNKPMTQKSYLDKKFILKPGKVLYYNHTHFNNDTLTDQIAANAIKKFPALVGAFLSEKERAILEAKAKAHHDITDAENTLTDEQFENQIIVLIDAEKFDEARKLIPKLLVKEAREAAEVAIDNGEEKAEAEKKITDEVEKVEDEKPEAKKPKVKRKAATKKKKNNAK